MMNKVLNYMKSLNTILLNGMTNYLLKKLIIIELLKFLDKTIMMKSKSERVFY